MYFVDRCFYLNILIFALTINKHLKLILIMKKQTFVGAVIATAQFLWCLFFGAYMEKVIFK